MNSEHSDDIFQVGFDSVGLCFCLQWLSTLASLFLYIHGSVIKIKHKMTALFTVFQKVTNTLIVIKSIKNVWSAISC